MTSFEPDSQFTMKVLSQLEEIGVTIFNELEDYKQPLQSVIGIDTVGVHSNLSSFSILNAWLQRHTSLHPTWRHFFWALREIQLNHLADQIQSYLSGVSIDKGSSSNLGPTLVIEEPEWREKENNGEEGEPNQW